MARPNTPTVGGRFRIADGRGSGAAEPKGRHSGADMLVKARIAGSVKGEAATVAPPSGSASSHGPPLSPSTTSKSPELPGTSAGLSVSLYQCHFTTCLLSSSDFSHLPSCTTCLCLPLKRLTCIPADELVQAGWSKCWSRRENRPYYFNRFTNQSLWEVPVLGQHDVIVSSLFTPVVHRLVTLSHFANHRYPVQCFSPAFLSWGG
ncbi:hypothetical protein XENORESO_016749 [Xenotaenia resolanae]|uniref:WW domain-containing protein n=1 Tax=Xenotaenia resolanae TaxID=208358 RepID=A0ABV0WLY5_9TELE